MITDQRGISSIKNKWKRQEDGNLIRLRVEWNTFSRISNSLPIQSNTVRISLNKITPSVLYARQGWWTKISTQAEKSEREREAVTVVVPAMISQLQSWEFQTSPEMSYIPLSNLCNIAYAFLLVSSTILGSFSPSILTDRAIHGRSSSVIHGRQKKWNERPHMNSTPGQQTYRPLLLQPLAAVDLNSSLYLMLLLLIKINHPPFPFQHPVVIMRHFYRIEAPNETF